MYHLRRFTIAAASFSVLVFLLWLLPRTLNPTPPDAAERHRDQVWVDTSPYWLDRQACRWLSLCGVHHVRWDAPVRPRRGSGNNGGGSDDDDGGDDLKSIELRSLWSRDNSHRWLARESVGDESWEIAGQQAMPANGQDENENNGNEINEKTENTKNTENTEKTGDAERPGQLPKPRPIPNYVLDYAPMVHLSSNEHFWPSDIGKHIRHMTALAGNGSAVPDAPHPLSLTNLAHVNGSHTASVFLTSDDDVESRPAWLFSAGGEPVPFEDGAGGTPDHRDRPLHVIDTDRFGRQIAEGTTWYAVDREHPLRRVSDPRKIYGLEMHFRRSGPQEVRAKRARAEQAAKTEETEDIPGDAADDDDLAAETAKAAAQAQQAWQEAEEARAGHQPDESGYSQAPAILVMVDKGSGILDAFWFFFYSYNLGQTVLRVRYGNHVGDWEHCMVRFEDGVPRALFLSEHAGGQAYAWSALEKRRPSTDDDGPALPARPVIYSAVGSHAMYAMPGNHPYVLPFQMLRDVTDRGPLWDPALHRLAYFYDYTDADNTATSLTPAAENPDAPTSWFHFAGPWGDSLYELGDVRQWRLFGQYHYVTGPQGPKFKNLGREKVCQTKRCRILYSLAAGKKASWYS